MSNGEHVHYLERVRVPFSYWAIALFFGLTFVTAASFMLGDVIFVVSTVAAIILITWTLLAWGSLTLRVDAHGVQVGRSRLEWPYVGRATAVDTEQRRRVLGREDVHFALRPYTSGVVVIGVADDADPHLCWMVSTRDPDALVGAIERNRPSGVADPTEQSALDSGG
ncbi:MAG: DUF3093 domain-containing protein [Micropruina sp.]|nr:DUF3093 domain-containing protein [Micropruina sp.]